MRFANKLRSRARDVLTAPPLVGAAYVLALAAWAGQRGASDGADLGDLRRAEAVETFIAHRFASEIVRMKVGIAATAVALGVVLGLVAEIVARLRRSPRAAARRSFVVAFVESLLLTAGLHAMLVLHAMAASPQLYASRWYARGGALRTVQVLATDVLGPRGVVVLLLVLVLAYVRPSRLVALGRRAAARARRVASRRGAAAATALVVVLAAAATGDAPTPASAAGIVVRDARAAEPISAPPMNVLLLAADSLRADRLDPRVAPTLSRLADRGTRFDRAYVSIPRTFPSWVTILTGRHAHHHGVRSMFPTWEDRARDFDAVPSRLARAGWSTAVVSDYAGDIFGRIDLGFERVDTPSFDFRQLIRQRALERETPLLPVLHSRIGRAVFPVMRELSDAADPMLLAADVERRIRALPKDRPFFLTAFFSTAHFPYAAPAPYYAKYTDPAYRGRFKYHKPVGLGREAPPDADDVRQIRALYDGAVAAIDDAIGRVLGALASTGLAERTIVIVTADHGETLYDHGHGQGHGDHLFGDEGTHVPLVVYDPREEGGRRVPGVVRDVDIAPTIYELTGVAAPADLDGASLAAAVRGGDAGRRTAFAETELWFTEEIPSLPSDLRLPYPGIMALTELDARHDAEIVLKQDVVALTTMARHRMVRDERWKLVYVPTRTGVKYMLFDVVADPAEVHDLAEQHPAEVARLRAELWAWMLKDTSMEARDGFLVPRDPRPRARAEAKR
jgi:arylsulfatase A-like enzyme